MKRVMHKNQIPHDAIVLSARLSAPLCPEGFYSSIPAQKLRSL
ncbi:hypothetical protein OAN54_01985 [Gammaproteobacteria bacterium]|nr:hypothetical protein [Gammaproteobacteria bacterium]